MPSNSSQCSSPPRPYPFRSAREVTQLAIFCVCVCVREIRKKRTRYEWKQFFSAIGKMKKKTICKREIIKSVKIEQTVFGASAKLAVTLSYPKNIGFRLLISFLLFLIKYQKKISIFYLF